MRKKVFKRVMAAMMALFTAAAVHIAAPATVEAAGGKTGAGLAEFAIMAYNQGWKYQYGAASWGVTDCSGLMYVYTNGATPRSSSGQINGSSESGPISSIPRIHGLGLWKPGHVGVYVGNGMFVDNSEPGVNMRYQAVTTRLWGTSARWYKVPGVSYPTTGWVTFNGNKYYYENGQYVVSCTKTIDGTSYTFNANGTVQGGGPSGGDTANQVAAPAGGSGQAAAKSGSSSTASPAPKTVQEPSYTKLSVGAQGSAVKSMQQRLSDLGYYYEGINDYYDYALYDAIALYQKEADLEVTGEATVETQKSLFGSNAPENPSKGTIYPDMHSSLVHQMQERLVELGYMSGETSTFYGEATKAAVLKYQKAVGLEENGIMDAAALEGLYAESAPKAVRVEDLADATAFLCNLAVDTTGQYTPVSSEISTASLTRSDDTASKAARSAFIPTVEAAVMTAEIEPAEEDNGNSVVAFLLVVLCVSLTSVIFVFRKMRINGPTVVLAERVQGMAGGLLKKIKK